MKPATTPRITPAICAAALGLCALAVGATLDAPSEAQEEADVALQVTDARIDEWVQAAQRANPHLAPHELARIRAAAIYAEAHMQRKHMQQP